MADLKVELLPWQQDVYEDPTRFKVVAAGRRCGKSRLAAWLLNSTAVLMDASFAVQPPTKGIKIHNPASSGKSCFFIFPSLRS